MGVTVAHAPHITIEAKGGPGKKRYTYTEMGTKVRLKTGGEWGDQKSSEHRRQANTENLLAHGLGYHLMSFWKFTSYFIACIAVFLAGPGHDVPSGAACITA